MSPKSVTNNSELGDPNPSNFQGGFINKKYIFKNIKISKIKDDFSTWLHSQGFSINILMFGLMELDLLTPVSHPPKVISASQHIHLQKYIFKYIKISKIRSMLR
jgi:hypothetical protein